MPGNGQQVSFFCSDIATFDQHDFDAAYTMHVQMNIADKKSFFTEIARHLAPGARFAVFEVCRNGEIEPALPLPWSLDGTDSFLSAPDELCETILSSGFELVEWVDETSWVRQWFADASGRVTTGGTNAILPAILDDGPTRMRNFAIALNTGVVTIHRGAFVLAG